MEARKGGRPGQIYFSRGREIASVHSKIAHHFLERQERAGLQGRYLSAGLVRVPEVPQPFVPLVPHEPCQGRDWEKSPKIKKLSQGNMAVTQPTRPSGQVGARYEST